MRSSVLAGPSSRSNSEPCLSQMANSFTPLISLPPSRPRVQAVGAERRERLSATTAEGRRRAEGGGRSTGVGVLVGGIGLTWQAGSSRAPLCARTAPATRTHFAYRLLVLLCHFSPATPYRGDGSGRSKTAADRRSAVGGLFGCDCRCAGACAPGGRGAGLLHRPAAAWRAQGPRADGGAARPHPCAGQTSSAAPRGGTGGLGRCRGPGRGAGAGAAGDRAAWAGALLDCR